MLLFNAFAAFGQKGQIDSCYSFLDTLTNQQVFKLTDQTPKVEGGMEQLIKELSKRIKYPHIDKYPIDTNVIVGFIITEDGQLAGKRIIKDFRGYGKQLLDILDDFYWQPGICNGKKVATLQLFPMNFKL